jgi:hypothetical protein
LCPPKPRGEFFDALLTPVLWFIDLHDLLAVFEAAFKLEHCRPTWWIEFQYSGLYRGRHSE